MRLRDARMLHTLALYALPVAVAGLGFGVAAALVATVFMALVGMVVRLRAVQAAARSDEPVPRLHSISFSH